MESSSFVVPELDWNQGCLVWFAVSCRYVAIKCKLTCQAGNAGINGFHLRYYDCYLQKFSNPGSALPVERELRHLA